MANILSGIAVVLGAVLNFMLILIVIRAIISWVNPDPFNPIVKFLQAATEPFLRPLRRFIPPIGGGLDLTPMVLILIVLFMQQVLVQSLQDYALHWRMKTLEMPVGTP